MIKFLLVVLLAIFTYSCQSVSEGFTLKKKNNADEFLVEKKNPLVLPPNFNELPNPDSAVSTNNEKQNKSIQGKLSKALSKDSNTKSINKSKSTSIEESILEKIKNNESNQ